jgi:hypothetical protein
MDSFRTCNGWDFFGLLLTGMIAAMRPFSPAELDIIERFLHEVAAVTRWQDGALARDAQAADHDDR